MRKPQVAEVGEEEEGRELEDVIFSPVRYSVGTTERIVIAMDSNTG